MTRRPKVTDDTAGQYQVTISFRVTDDKVDPNDLEADIGYALGETGYHLAALDIAINKIGGQGEASMHENPVGLTEDVRVARTVRDRENVEARGEYL